MDLIEMIEALRKLPQTQKDIRQIAQTTETAQSPEVQQALQEARASVEMYATTQLVMQALMVGGIVILAVLAAKQR